VALAEWMTVIERYIARVPKSSSKNQEESNWLSFVRPNRRKKEKEKEIEKQEAHDDRVRDLLDVRLA
jgi:hypothetical protein